MARSINKTTILGYVGNDPDVRFLPSGNPVCNFRIATSESWKDKNTGQKQEKTEWHSIVAFNKLAEIIQQYVHKGSRIYVEGKLQTRKWQDKDGNDRYSTEILINDMLMLDGSNGGQQQGGYQQQHPQQQQPPQGQGQQQYQPNNQRQQPNGYQQAQNGMPPQQQTGAPQGFDDFDDSIPF